MKTFTLFSFLFFLLPSLCSGNCREFIHQITGKHHERPTHLVTDNNDNIIVAGLFKGAAQIGSHKLEGGGDNDIFLIKFNPEGHFLWTTTIEIGGPDFGWLEYVRALKSDKDGNILVLGLFREHVIHGNDTLHGTNTINHFLMKFDANGQMMWAKTLHTTRDNNSGAIEVDGEGDVYLSVSYIDTLKFDHLTFLPVDSNNFILFKISSGGNLLWHNNLFSSNKPNNAFLGFADNDKYIVTGSYSQGTILDLKDTTLLTPGNSPGGIYFLEFDNNRNFTRAIFGNSDSPFDWVYKVIKGNDGYYYAVGLMMSTLSIGQFTVSAANPGSWLEQDIFFLKMDTNGNVVWLKNFGSVKSGPTGLSDMVLDYENNLFIFGDFYHNISIDHLNYTSKGRDLYIAKYSQQGNLIEVFTTEAKEALISSMYAGGLGLNSREEILFSASFSWETYIRDTLIKNTQLEDGLVMKLCGLTTSIDKQIDNDLLLNIFPNPTNSIVNIKSQTNTRINRIEVVNIQGQLVLQVYKPSETLDISTLSNGFYIINIHTEKGIVRKKIVKQ